MSATPPSPDPNPQDSPLKRENEIASNALIIETGESKPKEEIVLASNVDGGSLTLLEEYSIRENNSGKWAAIIAFACAASSLAFAYLIYSTL